MASVSKQRIKRRGIHFHGFLRNIAVVGLLLAIGFKSRFFHANKDTA